MTRLVVENEVDHNYMAIKGCYRVSEGCRELTHIYKDSPESAVRLYCEGNDLNFSDVDIDDRTNEGI